MSRLHFNVAGSPNGDEPVMVADQVPDLRLTGPFSGDPINRWSVTIPSSVTGGATVGYDKGSSRFRVIVPPGDGDWEAGQAPCLPPEYGGDAEKVALIYRPTAAPLPALIPTGHVFRSGAARFYGIMASGFAAFERYLKDGEAAVRPVLEQRQALGFNVMRWWTAYDVPLIGRLVPREWADYPDRLTAFVRLCQAYGQYSYVTSLTGPWTGIFHDGTDLVEHVRRVEWALSGTTALSDRRNEYDHPANAAAKNLTLKPAPPGLLWSAGSGQQDVRPPEPFGPFYGFHPASNEWHRKVGKQGVEVDPSRPCCCDETVRVEQIAMGETTLRHIEDAAACGQMFGAAGCFHSPSGKLFALYGGDELQAAQAWVRGSTRFDLTIVQDGQYANVTAPPFLRIYEKRLGDRVARLELMP